jgi:hypothetical protein
MYTVQTSGWRRKDEEIGIKEEWMEWRKKREGSMMERGGKDGRFKVDLGKEGEESE